MRCAWSVVDGQAVVTCAANDTLAPPPPCSVEHCEAPGTRLCDWKLGDGRTCDARLCDRHSHSPARRKDLCPAHREAWRRHPANPQRALDL